jgi:hypothetical protein
MQRSFKNRLEALERLEVERAIVNRPSWFRDYPPYAPEPWDLAECQPWENMFTLLASLRDRNIGYRDGQLVFLQHSEPEWAAFLHDLITRCQPLIDECPKPFIALLAEDIPPALALLDSGRVSVSTHRSLYLGSGGRDEQRAIEAVNFAYALLVEQDPEAPALATVDDWRAWLVEMVTPIEEATE